MNAWNVVLTTALLTAAVSFFVAGTIHLLCLLIRLFSKPASEPLTANAVVPPPSGSQHDTEIAIAIASVKAYLNSRS